MGHVLDPLCDESQAVPYDEDARRRWQVPANVDHDAVAAGEQRLHGVSVHKIFGGNGLPAS